MRRRKSCQQCHTRHKRCVTRKGHSKCSECEETGTECEAQPRLQFRFSHGLPARRRPKRKELPTRQEDSPTELQLVQEIPPPPSNPVFRPQSEEHSPHGAGTDGHRSECSVAETTLETSSLPANHAAIQEIFDDTSRSSFTSTIPSGFLMTNDAGCDVDGNLGHGISPESQNLSPTKPKSDWIPPQLTPREAALMRVYIQRITLSVGLLIC